MVLQAYQDLRSLLAVHFHPAETLRADEPAYNQNDSNSTRHDAGNNQAQKADDVPRPLSNLDAWIHRRLRM